MKNERIQLQLTSRAKKVTNQTPVLMKRWYKVAQPHHLWYSKPGKINMCIHVYLTPALGELADTHMFLLGYVDLLLIAGSVYVTSFAVQSYPNSQYAFHVIQSY